VPSKEKQENDQNDTKLEEKLMKKLDKLYAEYFLSDFQKFAVTKFIKENIAARDNMKVERIRNWLFNKLNGVRQDTPLIYQRGCPDIVPGLTATPWWDTSKFDWVKNIEENVEVIKDELIALRGLKGFQPYRGPSWASQIKSDDGVGSKSNDSGEWNVFYLFLHDMKFEENCQKCPKTVELIEKYVPRQYQHAFFSAVTPGTHIIKHNGPTNKKLRLHFPLLGVDKSRLRVGEETKFQEAGKCYIFDDSFEHEAWHDGNETRVILIVDLWHPDLTNDEVKFLSLLQKARMKYERAFSAKDPDKDNFYTIIDIAKDLLTSNDWWSINEEEIKKSEERKAKEKSQEEDNDQK